MPNLNTANFALDGLTQKRRLKDRLEDRWITPQAFGALANGLDDDTAAIQATFDYAFGAFGDEHGLNESYLNKVVFFPNGIYNITAPLRLNVVYGGVVLGAGSYQSIIRYVGDEVVGTDDLSSLLECHSCMHIHISGLTLDCNNIQMAAMRSLTYPGGNGDGHDGFYRDMQFINGNRSHDTPTSGGAGHYVGLGVSAGMGSERTYTNCQFRGFKWGLRLIHANALNHHFYNCIVSDCDVGFSGQTGGQVSGTTCLFENNERDVELRIFITALKGCRSNSINFAALDGSIIGCLHDAASVGQFYENLTNNVRCGALLGNRSTNGTIVTNGDTTPGSGAHLIANDFQNPDYLDPTLAYLSGVGGICWEDGVQVSGPDLTP